MRIQLKQLRPEAVMPRYLTSGSAASDVAACLDDAVVLQPGERAIIPTGFAIAVPLGYEAQLRARSGLSSKFGICLANGIGTIDADYRGEVGVILINLGSTPYTIEPGARIAQMAIVACDQVDFEWAETLDETERGQGGYGSTGH